MFLEKWLRDYDLLEFSETEKCYCFMAETINKIVVGH